MFAAALEASVPSSPRAEDRHNPDRVPNGVSPTSHDEASAESFPASDPPAASAGITGVGDPNGKPAAPRPAGVPSDRARRPVPMKLAGGAEFEVDHGHVVIAAITSCTNTSNPSVMLAAGLLAKKAVERGLTTKPWVKTSLAPGSKVVMDYYE